MRVIATAMFLSIISTSAGALSGDLDIKTASEGLKRIQRDAFGVIKLPVLKQLAVKNKNIRLEKKFPATTGSRRLTVRVDGSGAAVSFHAEIPLEKPAADYDLDLATVKSYVETLDVGFPDGNDFSTSGLTWQWETSDFQCRLQYVDESYTSSLLSYECKYETRAMTTPVRLEGGALSHYLGVIACVDRAYFDGGYVPGESDREALMNALLKKLSLPAYDESLMDSKSNDTDAYMQGYSDCDESYQFLDAQAAKLGIEPDY